MSEKASSIGDIADDLKASGHDGQISVAELLDALGTRSHFTMIMAVAAVAATPLSGIPGVSVVCGLLIALIAAERLVRRDDIYLPAELRKRAIDSESVRSMLTKLRPGIDFIDRHTHRRFQAVFRAPLKQIILVICVLSGLSMPFLEFIPFTSSIVAAGVLCISISFVTRDGIFALISLIPYCGIALVLSGVF